MKLDLHDQVIIITGAGRGLGRALAEGLAVEGARLALWDLDGDSVREAAKEIAAAVPDVQPPLAQAVDVGDEAQVEAATQEVERHWGRIDALINNAGWMPPVQPVTELDAGVLRRVIDVNLIGCFLTTKHVASVMVRQRRGRIIYVSSIMGVQANHGQSAYGATKAGVTLLANVAHRELADQGIRTVAIAPGLTDTPGMRLSVDDAYIADVAAKYPGGRLGQPEDVVAFVSFLCSDAAQHISGTFLPIRPIAG